MAGYARTYRVAMSQADDDLAATGDESAHAEATQTARDNDRASAAGGIGGRKLALATGDKDYADAIYGTDAGSEGSGLLWQRARQDAATATRWASFLSPGTFGNLAWNHGTCDSSRRSNSTRFTRRRGKCRSRGSLEWPRRLGGGPCSS